jgi:hypothetical protein
MARQYQMIDFINEGATSRQYQVGGMFVNEVIGGGSAQAGAGFGGIGGGCSMAMFAYYYGFYR